MKILFLLTEPPYPADNGIRIITFNIIRLMRKLNHECAIAIVGTVSTDEKRALTQFCIEHHVKDLGEYPLPEQNKTLLALHSIVTHTPYFVNKYLSKYLEATLDKLCNHWQPDTVHYDTICLTGYSRPSNKKIKIVASINDSYTLTLENEINNSHLPKWRKWYKKYQYHVVRQYERRAYNRFDAVHVVSKKDADTLKDIGITSKIVVISNGVSHLIKHQKITQNPHNLLFVAKQAGENLSALNQFISQAWPIIKAKNPNICLQIIGRETPASLSMNKEINDPQIKFIGFVEDINDIYAKGQIAIVPINKNCGIINKAIEAMAAGLPVVGFESCFSALLEAKPGQHYLAGQSFLELAEHINFLLDNPERSEQIGLLAHELAKTYYSWEARTEALEDLYKI